MRSMKESAADVPVAVEHVEVVDRPLAIGEGRCQVWLFLVCLEPPVFSSLCS